VTELDLPAAADDAGRADRRRAAAQVRAARASARAAARAVPPQRVAELGHLSLAALRTYRAALAAEEDRVSYWRRILQARLDTLHEAEGRPADLLALRSVLTAEQVTRGRSALVRVVPDSQIPPLPDLAALWERVPHPDDAAAQRALKQDLGQAESTLSEYRSVLHKQLDVATHEMIARYRDEPDSCLSALPGERPQ